MKGLLICSGNDAAIAIAEHVGGSVEDFCDMMNQKAAVIGANDTHFVTPHGLDRENHYTTAHDLTVMAEYLLNIPYLAEIVDSREATIMINGNIRKLRTTNEMLGIYPNARGVKTGYTGKAGRCLVTALESGDREIITVVLGCATKKQRTSETMWLLNYALTEYEVVDIFENVKPTLPFSVEKASPSKYEISVNVAKRLLLPKGEKEQIHYEYQIKQNLVAPLEENTLIGEIQVILGNSILDIWEIRLPVAIERKNVWDYFYEIWKRQSIYATFSA